MLHLELHGLGQLGRIKCNKTWALAALDEAKQGGTKTVEIEIPGTCYSPPSSPLFPATLPSTLPGTFGDLASLCPVAGAWGSKVGTHLRNPALKTGNIT